MKRSARVAYLLLGDKVDTARDASASETRSPSACSRHINPVFEQLSANAERSRNFHKSNALANDCDRCAIRYKQSSRKEVGLMLDFIVPDTAARAVVKCWVRRVLQQPVRKLMHDGVGLAC